MYKHVSFDKTPFAFGEITILGQGSLNHDPSEDASMYDTVELCTTRISLASAAAQQKKDDQDNVKTLTLWTQFSIGDPRLAVSPSPLFGVDGITPSVAYQTQLDGPNGSVLKTTIDAYLEALLTRRTVYLHDRKQRGESGPDDFKKNHNRSQIWTPSRRIGIVLVLPCVDPGTSLQAVPLLVMNSSSGWVDNLAPVMCVSSVSEIVWMIPEPMVNLLTGPPPDENDEEKDQEKQADALLVAMSNPACEQLAFACVVVCGVEENCDPFCIVCTDDRQRMIRGACLSVTPTGSIVHLADGSDFSMEVDETACLLLSLFNTHRFGLDDSKPVRFSCNKEGKLCCALTCAPRDPEPSAEIVSEELDFGTLVQLPTAQRVSRQLYHIPLGAFERELINRGMVCVQALFPPDAEAICKHICHYACDQLLIAPRHFTYELLLKRILGRHKGLDKLLFKIMTFFEIKAELKDGTDLLIP